MDLNEKELQSTSDLKISQVLSTARRSLPIDTRQRPAKTLPTRSSTKRLVKRPDYGLLVAKSKKDETSVPTMAQYQQQAQYIKELEKDNVEMRRLLLESRETIINMNASMNNLLTRVDEMLTKERILPTKMSDRSSTSPRFKASSPLRNGDATRKHQLPITTLEGFKVFNNNLMNKDFFNNVVDSLRSQKIAKYIEATSKLGPQDPETVMIFITKILLAPQVLGQFKWNRRANDSPKEPIFRMFDFFRSLFMTLVNKTCFGVLTQIIDQKTYENFFRARIQREAIQLQKLIKIQIRQLEASSSKKKGREMEVDSEQVMWQSEEENASQTVAFSDIEESLSVVTAIKTEPLDFVDVMQSSSTVDTSIVKKEQTEEEEAVFNTWTTGSGNES